MDVEHGLGANYKKIRTIQIIVREDSDTYYYSSDATYSSVPIVQLWVNFITPTYIRIRSGNNFQSGIFDDTSYNRGWVTITYEA
ncbi:hypothetical protein ES703_123043 [subsurface metagenome]